MSTWNCCRCDGRMYNESEFRDGRHRECRNDTTELTFEDLEALIPWLDPAASQNAQNREAEAAGE